MGSHGGDSAVFLFPKAAWVMERVVLIPLEHFAGCCGRMENVSVLGRARRGLELCGADVECGRKGAERSERPGTREWTEPVALPSNVIWKMKL